MEYTPGLMEDDYTMDKARDPGGVRVANYADYRQQFFIKEGVTHLTALLFAWVTCKKQLKVFNGCVLSNHI